MIQFHNLSLTETTPSATGSSNSTTNPANLASFESALSEAIAATFKQFGIDPSSVNISITPESGSSSASSTAATNSAPVTETAPYDPFLQAASSTPAPEPSASPSPSSSTAPTASAATSNTSASGSTDPNQAFDDAYWAQQPPAVQALRNMQPDQRAEVARNLASEGYTIDVPIMVWGWDPSIATSLRQSFGYTWVPSGLQNPVESMPGIAPLAGLTAYNPNQPPPGSIMV